MDSKTEKIIFDAALDVFQKKGFAAAKLKEIAEQANINQSLLHYYFRKKEVLFKSVLKYKILEILGKITQVLKTTDSLFNNLDEVIKVYHDIFVDNPNMPLFLISELNNNPTIIRELFEAEEINRFRATIAEHLNKSDLKGHNKVPPEQILVSIASMVIFPFLAKEIIKLIFNLDESQSKEFIESRDQLLPELIKKIIS